jgi:hypothetical protein
VSGLADPRVRTSSTAHFEIVDSSLQRGKATYVVRHRHSRFASNHGSPGAVFATSSRRIVCLSSRINIGWTASRIFADTRRRLTELLRTTTVNYNDSRPLSAAGGHSLVSSNSTVIPQLTQHLASLGKALNRRSTVFGLPCRGSYGSTSLLSVVVSILVKRRPRCESSRAGTCTATLSHAR